MSLAADILLALAVALASLGAAGFLALTGAYDRLHCVAFVAATAGFCITLAVFITHPFTPVAFKTIALYVLSLANGAVLAHATGRALHLRDEDAARGAESTR